MYDIRYKADIAMACIFIFTVYYRITLVFFKTIVLVLFLKIAQNNVSYLRVSFSVAETVDELC